ncbi:MAG: DUF3343 domain-containing protein [Clostridiales bacterium]|nr:DUF3343 domain-containing protein [Clostridiales bacterium]
MDTLASFRSRSEAIRLHNALSMKRIATTLINMPSAFKVGCGLSVVFPSSKRNEVNLLIQSLGLNSFIGFFVK